METANWHTYQVLTKRSARLRDMLQTKLQFAAELPHIWWGVSVEDRKHGLPRIEHLHAGPGRGPLPVHRAAARRPRRDRPGRHPLGDRRRRERTRRPADEEGMGGRIRRQCEQGVPFFFKQWGGVRKARPAGYWTTALTMNIRSASESLFLTEQGQPRSLRHSSELYRNC